MAEPEYRIAYSVAPLAATLITDHHHELDGFAILYLFCAKPKKSQGRRIAGKTQKLSGLNRFLSSGFPDEHLDAEDGYDAAIVIDHELWEKHEVPWRTALLDHELSHLTTSEDGDLTYRAHDVEEFVEIIQRHGIWGGETESQLAAFVKAAQQIGMPLDVGQDTGEIVTPEPAPPSEFERGREKALAMPAGRRVQ